MKGSEETASKLFDLGVGDLVAIHFQKDLMCTVERWGEGMARFLALPKGYIKGAAEVPEMLFVQECSLVFMKTGHSRNPCSVPVRQLPACPTLLVRMDYAHSMSVWPLPENSGLGKTKRKKNCLVLELGLIFVIKGSIL